MDLQDYRVKNRTICDCEHEFTLKDMTELKRIGDDKFYGGVVKHVSETTCPQCTRQTLLFLKQVGQTYKIVDIAQKDLQTIAADKSEITVNSVYNQGAELEYAPGQTQISSDEVNIISNELICPNCKRSFKSKQGLAVHSKTCQK